MGRHGKVDDAASLVCEQYQHEHESVGGRRDDEEVSGDDLPGVVLQEGAPCL